MTIQPTLDLPIADIIDAALHWTWWKHCTLLRVGDDVVGAKVRVQDPKNMHATLVKTVRERDFAAAFVGICKLSQASACARDASLPSEVLHGSCSDACDVFLQLAVFGEEVFA